MIESDAPKSELILYRTEDGRTRIECRFEGETIWLTQALIAELFDKDVRTINEHIVNIYDENELVREATVRKFRIVRTEGNRSVSREIEHYNLDVVLAVGYRVRSHRGTQFRQWATARLTEYLVKGFTLDDQRLKRTDRIADYFDELLARIREIRASEARVYQRVREIFALASDYRESDREAQVFFAKMQNKMHFAATGLTAAEIVHQRADATKPNMGLTSWSGNRVLKRDVVTAKNYLDDEEIDTLNRIVVMFLDRAEFRARRRKDIKMADWEIDLDKFLADTELPVLTTAGGVSHELATNWANEQYDAFSDRRRIEAETKAEARYIEDLTATAKMLENSKMLAVSKAPKRRKKP
ncbi:MAG: virulence RhuM family protein [Polyangiaceae bacterium]|nr:virulence RhuM family protein [Polyangiaceae bacterium]